MNPALEFFLFIAAFAVLVFGLYMTLHWLGNPDDDAAAGILLGPDSQLSTPPLSTFGPTPDLLATQCMTCRCVRCVDRRWLPESLVPLPVGCRVSHGLCPQCERAAHEDLARLTEREEPQPA